MILNFTWFLLTWLSNIYSIIFFFSNIHAELTFMNPLQGKKVTD